MDNDINIAPHILIAVDDPDLRRISVAGLRSAGFSVSAPTDGDAAIMLAESFSPDVLIVCSNLRAPDGRPLHERLRDSSEQYLLCITDEGAHRTRAAMLHSGADDAVSVPVSPEELSARCHALLRPGGTLSLQTMAYGLGGFVKGALAMWDEVKDQV